MALTVLPLDLARWDETARVCLVLPVFRDDRPLRGSAGLVDWRLCGWLSRLIKATRATADRDVHAVLVGEQESQAPLGVRHSGSVYAAGKFHRFVVDLPIGEGIKFRAGLGLPIVVSEGENLKVLRINLGIVLGGH